MDSWIYLSLFVHTQSLLQSLGTTKTIYKQPSSRHFTFAEHFRFELTGYLRLVLFFLVEENRDRFALPTSISNLLPILHVTLTGSIQQIVFCGFLQLRPAFPVERQVQAFATHPPAPQLSKSARLPQLSSWFL